MRTFLILLNREIKAYFQSIVAYIVIAAVSLLHGVIFLKFVKALKSDSVPMALNQVMLLNNQFWLVLLLIIPLITMRLFSEEQKLGTLEPLLTAPVQSWQVIFSKYVAALLFYMVLYLPYMFYMVYFEMTVDASAFGGATAFNSPSFYGGYAMIFLIGLFFVAVGCLASALTSNQIIAAVISFTVLLIYFFLGLLRVQFNDLPQITVEFLEYISPIEHMRDWSAGFFDTRPVVYYVSFAALALALTHQVLDYRKWRI